MPRGRQSEIVVGQVGGPVAAEDAHGKVFVDDDQPCIRGLRIPVATVVAMVADGMTTEQIVAELPLPDPMT